MKNLDIKSLLLGVLACIITIALTSNKAVENNDNIEFVSSPAGLAIYNKETRNLYMYKMWNGNLKSSPGEVFKVSEDGASLAEVK